MYSTLPSYSLLTAPKRRMVELKQQGLTHVQIANAIVSEFEEATTTKNTVDDLFREGTACRAALLEWREYMADQAVAEARQLVRATYKDAITTLIELSKPPHAPNVRANAARALAQNLLSAKDLSKLPSEVSVYSEAINAEIAAIMRSALPEREAVPG
jgi:phosphoglycolate phosphatase-like HAD superfamily hydrolase